MAKVLLYKFLFAFCGKRLIRQEMLTPHGNNELILVFPVLLWRKKAGYARS